MNRFWVAHASRMLANASSRSRTFSTAGICSRSAKSRGSSFRRDAETSTRDRALPRTWSAILDLVEVRGAFGLNRFNVARI
jgi:hypothetical protein